MSEQPTYEIGPHSEIDPDVILGYTYRGWSRKLVIGDHAIIRSGSILYTNTTIGRRFTCGHHVVVRAECEIGDRVVILHKTTLEGRLKIGNAVKIMAHCYLPSTTRIGNYVFIGPGTTFLNARLPMREKAPVAGAIVEDGVCIGGGVTVGPGVTIGKNSFIGAGSVVNKDVPPDTLAYGVPARFQPLPEKLAGGNWEDLLVTGSDLWGGQIEDDAPQPDTRAT